MPMKVDSLEKLFVESLKDLYDAEHQLIKALPKMAETASSPDLKRGFQQHLEQTHQQVNRLEQIFSTLNHKPAGKKCMGMEGLIKEGEEHMKELEDYPDVLDAGMIAAAQKIEHYEISGYGTARAYAELLGKQDAVRLLTQTLDEEAQTDEKLTMLAETHINRNALV